MRLFKARGFQATTVLDIARAARVSRGTVFNYYPYKEAFLLEHLAENLSDIAARIRREGQGCSPLEALHRLFGELAGFVEAERQLVLPLGYELLNPDPERSRRAYTALPLAAILNEHLKAARERGLIRQDFSSERLARTLANAFFLTFLQWAAYRQDRSVEDELHKALTLALEGMVLGQGRVESGE